MLLSRAQSVCERPQDDIRGVIELQTCWLVPGFAADFGVSWTRGAGWEQHHPAEILCSLLPYCQPIVSGITPLLPNPYGPERSLVKDKNHLALLPCTYSPRWGERDGRWISVLVAL